MTQLVLGLAGPKGSGKTTLARSLKKNHGFFRCSFAAPIKTILGDLLYRQGVSRTKIERMLYGDKKETHSEFLSGRTPRYALQTLGTEWGRNLMGEDFWTEIWLNNIKKYSQERNIVADDLRFPSEAKTIRKLGGKLGRILRWEAPLIDSHPSETEFQKIEFDFVIPNHEGEPEAMLKVIEKEFGL
jgi:hypothetical protein